LEYFLAIWYIFPRFGIFTKTNLATLIPGREFHYRILPTSMYYKSTRGQFLKT
jgi:hypothetical protein